MSARRAAVTTGSAVVAVGLIALLPVTAQGPRTDVLAPGADRPVAYALLDDDDDWRRDLTPTTTPEPLPAPTEPPASTSLAVIDLAALEVDRSGIPTRVREAYTAAVARLAKDQPRCRLRWELLAGIGRIESDHGRYGGAVVQQSGRVEPAILGPRLDGAGPFAVIRDTDGGRYDGDAEFDRAVGPMQFIPGTWARWGADADSDGVDDPQDIDDAALAAGRYLCASGGRLDYAAGKVAAVYSYNHSYDYVRAVLTVAARYAGVSPLAFGTGLLPEPTPSPTPSETPTEAPLDGGVLMEPLPGAPPPAPSTTTGGTAALPTTTTPSTTGPTTTSPPTTTEPTTDPTTQPTTEPTTDPTTDPPLDPPTDPPADPTDPPTSGEEIPVDPLP